MGDPAQLLPLISEVMSRSMEGAADLVDNVPMDINRINPNDIESISVLKDASASAIYGAPRCVRRRAGHHQKW